MAARLRFCPGRARSECWRCLEVMEVGALTGLHEFQRTCDAEDGACGATRCVLPSWSSIPTRAFVASAWPEGKGTGPVGILPADLFHRASHGPVVDGGPIQRLRPLPGVPARRRGACSRTRPSHRLHHPGPRREERGQRSTSRTSEGRTLLQLEWRALAAASTVPAVRAKAVEDALAFRHERRALLLGRDGGGGRLEDNEARRVHGVALGRGGCFGAARALALRTSRIVGVKRSLVRSSAYASARLWPPADEARARRDGGVTSAGWGGTWAAAPDALAERARAFTRARLTWRRRLVRPNASGPACPGSRRRGPAQEAGGGPCCASCPLMRMRIQFNPGSSRRSASTARCIPARIVDTWGSLTVTRSALSSTEDGHGE